jgi:Holliday junction DNA helicase RuvB
LSHALRDNCLRQKKFSKSSLKDLRADRFCGTHTGVDLILEIRHMRPQTLDEMIGHEHARRKSRIAIQAAMVRNEPLPHTLITSAGGGLGKTTLAQVLANEMFTGLISTSGPAVQSPYDLRNLLLRIKPKDVVLIDEFHATGKTAMEELLLIMEFGHVNVSVGRRGPVRLPLPPLTIIGSTTKPEAVSAPLAQRFGLRFDLQPLLLHEIHKIVESIFATWELGIGNAGTDEIARRARGIPRMALRLSERVRDVVQSHSGAAVTSNDLQVAFTLEGIDEIGLVPMERRLLRYLADAEPRPVSLRSLALSLGLGLATVSDSLEPGLLRLGLMSIGAGGRRLTTAGADHLSTVEGATHD